MSLCIWLSHSYLIVQNVLKWLYLFIYISCPVFIGSLTLMFPINLQYLQLGSELLWLAGHLGAKCVCVVDIFSKCLTHANVYDFINPCFAVILLKGKITFWNRWCNYAMSLTVQTSLLNDHFLQELQSRSRCVSVCCRPYNKLLWCLLFEAIFFKALLLLIFQIREISIPELESSKAFCVCLDSWSSFFMWPIRSR